MTKEMVAAVAKGLQARWPHPRWLAVAPSVAQTAVAALEAGGWRIVWDGPTWRQYRNHSAKGMVFSGMYVLAGQITWEDAQRQYPGIRREGP